MWKSLSRSLLSIWYDIKGKYGDMLFSRKRERLKMLQHFPYRDYIFFCKKYLLLFFSFHKKELFNGLHIFHCVNKKSVLYMKWEHSNIRVGKGENEKSTDIVIWNPEKGTMFDAMFIEIHLKNVTVNIYVVICQTFDAWNMTIKRKVDSLDGLKKKNDNHSCVQVSTWMSKCWINHFSKHIMSKRLNRYIHFMFP